MQYYRVNYSSRRVRFMHSIYILLYKNICCMILLVGKVCMIFSIHILILLKSMDNTCNICTIFSIFILLHNNNNNNNNNSSSINRTTNFINCMDDYTLIRSYTSIITHEMATITCIYGG